MNSQPSKGRTSPSALAPRPRRAKAPDLSYGAAPGRAPRLVEPAELWPAWTDDHTYEAGSWQLGPDDAAVPPGEWPGHVGEAAFRAAPPPGAGRHQDLPHGGAAPSPGRPRRGC